MSARSTGGYVIRLRHEALPAGLSAILRRRADGDLEVIVSTALSGGRQRAAVRAGLQTMEPARRRVAPLPLPALITLALGGTWLRTIGRLLRVRPAATIAVAATAAAAVVAIAAAPHLHGPAVTGRNPPGAAVAPPGPRAGPAHAGATPSAPIVAQPAPSAMPVAAHSSTGSTAPSATSQPFPATSAGQQTPGTPTPTPTPSGTGGGNGICLEVLGLWVCL
jgi:hypothetical protein